MAVDLCTRLFRVEADDVLDVTMALERINRRIYERGEVTEAPWSLRWDPDDFGSSVKMRDVRILEREGKGSCHELAAAYAAWSRYQNRKRVWIEVMPDSVPKSWHVVAHAEDQILDPQMIGGTRHGPQ